MFFYADRKGSHRFYLFLIKVKVIKALFYMSFAEQRIRQYHPFCFSGFHKCIRVMICDFLWHRIHLHPKYYNLPRPGQAGPPPREGDMKW